MNVTFTDILSIDNNNTGSYKFYTPNVAQSINTMFNSNEGKKLENQ